MSGRGWAPFFFFFNISFLSYMCMNYCNGVKLGLCDYAYPLSGLGGAVEEQGCGLEIMRECFILHACSFSHRTHTYEPTQQHKYPHANTHISGTRTNPDCVLDAVLEDDPNKQKDGGGEKERKNRKRLCTSCLGY